MWQRVIVDITKDGKINYELQRTVFWKDMVTNVLKGYGKKEVN